MALSKDTLLQIANQIRYERNVGQNSAERVGRALVEIIEALGDVFNEEKLLEFLQKNKFLDQVTFDDNLKKKLDTSLFTKIFTPVDKELNELSWEEAIDSELFYAIKSQKGFFSLDFISAKGINNDVSSGTGKSYLSDLLDVSVGSLSDGDSLVWDAASHQWTNKRVHPGTGGGLNETELGKYLTEKQYATQSWVEAWVNSQGFLKSVLWNDINGKPSWIGATKPTYSWGEITDKPSWIGTTKPTYAWSEITDKPSWIGANKPTYSFSDLTSHPTTLAGYGITDALSKDEASNTFVKKTGDTMTGLLNANGGISIPMTASLKIGDAVITWDPIYEGLKITSGLYSEKWISVKGVNNNVGSGSGGLDETQLGQYLTQHGYATQQWVLSQSFATQSWVLSQLGNIQLDGYLSLSGGTMKNTNLVGNLNADLLDGQHGEWYQNNVRKFRYVGTSSSLNLNTALEGGGIMSFYGDPSGAPSNWIGGSGTVVQLQGVYISGQFGWNINHNDSSNPTNLLFFRAANNLGFASDWKTIAFTTSNVASASRLATTSTYTAWGQPFFANGMPVSLSGSLSSVIDINMTGTLRIGACEISWDGTGLKFSKGIYSEQWISAKGKNDDMGSGTSGFGKLLTIQRNGVKIGEYDGTLEKTINITVPTSTSALNNDMGFITSSALDSYATKTWVEGLGYATSSQLSNYLSLSGGTMRNTNVVTNLNADLLDGVHLNDIPNYVGWVSNPGYDAKTRGNYIAFTYGNNAPFTGAILSLNANNYGFQLGSGYWFSQNLYYRSYGSEAEGGWGAWKQVAFTTSNVASADYATSAGSATNSTNSTYSSYATQLLNSRNIWGQPFNGTSDINGTLSILNKSPLLFSTYGGGWYMEDSDWIRTYGGKNIYQNTGTLRTDGTLQVGSGYTLIANAGGNVGINLSSPSYRLHVNGSTGFGGHLYLTGTLASGSTSNTSQLIFGSSTTQHVVISAISDKIIINPSTSSTTGQVALGVNGQTTAFTSTGNFGIGTDSPSYKLHLVGTFYASGAATLSSTLSVAGLITAQSGIKIGNGTISWDTTYGCFRFSHGLYSDSFISAKGVNSSTGGGVSGDYLPLTGGTLTGNLNITKSDSTTAGIMLTNTLGKMQVAVGSDGKMGLWNQTAQSWIFYSTSTATYLLTGNVAVGLTTTPSYKLHVQGTIGATGAVSQNVSDLRLKTDIQSIDCLEILGRIGNVFSYRYNGLAVSDRDWLDTTTTHYGVAYQNAIRADIPGFTGTDDKGYGFVNFLSSDMLALVTGGVLQLAIRQRMIENDVNALRQRVSQLEERIKELEAA